MKTYVLTLSQTFPAKHPKAGQPTGFVEKLRTGHVEKHETLYPAKIKIHTIRGNYPMWSKRFEEIDKGDACLSLRIWSGKPYHSKQIEIARLTKEDGIGLEKLEITGNYAGFNNWQHFNIDGHGYMSINDLPNSDGLDRYDWIAWMKLYDISKPLAIIHFTQLRHNTL